MTFADRLRSAREEKGLSQEAAAALVGVSRQAVGRWESGQSMPSTANLLRLSEIYGIPLEELCGRAPASLAEPRAAEDERILQLLGQERVLRAMRRRGRILRGVVGGAAVALSYAALFLFCRLIWVPRGDYSLLEWLFGNTAARQVGYLYGWLCQQGIFLFCLLLSSLPALAGLWRFGAVTFSGFVLGLLLGELLGPNPAGAAQGMSHYGWLIWGVIFFVSVLLGLFAELRARRRQAKNSAGQNR